MFLLVYLRLYGKCFTLALKGIGKNLWTLALPVAVFVSYGLLASLLGGIKYIGGFVFGLLVNALFSAYLYFTGGVVAQQKMTLGELKKSFGAYFWSVMGLFFVLWIFELFIGPALGARAMLALNAVAFIALNPAPEVIYSKGTRGGLDTITTCMKFLGEAWIEWFIPNLLIAGGVYLFFTRVMPRLPEAADLPLALAAGMFFHGVMVFRGHVFQELDGSTHRQRMFKYRNANS